MSKSAEKHAAPHADVPKYLKQTNPYFQTLANPANVHGVRIPDGGGVETITFTEVVRSTMCSSASAGYEGAATIIGVSQMNKDNEKNPIFPYSLVPACAFKGSAYPYYLGARTTAGNTEYLFTAADFDSADEVHSAPSSEHHRVELYTDPSGFGWHPCLPNVFKPPKCGNAVYGGSPARPVRAELVD